MFPNILFLWQGQENIKASYKLDYWDTEVLKSATVACSGFAYQSEIGFAEISHWLQFDRLS